MKKISIKQFAIIAMLVALNIVLSRFLSISAWNMKIGFSFVPIALAALLYGPWPAAIVGAVGDLLGALLFPSGPFFPGFTVTAALTGIVYGFLIGKEQKLWRIIAASAINQFIIGLLINTLWISILYGSDYGANFVTRIPQCVILFVIEIVVIKLLSFSIPLLKNEI